MAALTNVELIAALLSCNRQPGLVGLRLRIINGVVSLQTTEVHSKDRWSVVLLLHCLDPGGQNLRFPEGQLGPYASMVIRNQLIRLYGKALRSIEADSVDQETSPEGDTLGDVVPPSLSASPGSPVCALTWSQFPRRWGYARPAFMRTSSVRSPIA